MKRISLNKVMAKLAEEQKVDLYAQDDINAIIKQWQKINNELGQRSASIQQNIQDVNRFKNDIKQLENKLEMLIETVQEGAAELGIRQLPKYATDAQQMLKMWYAGVEGIEAAIKRAF
jgi:archaellum component FlaC